MFGHTSIIHMLSLYWFVHERSGFFSGEKKKKLMLSERTVSETICFLAERI